MPIPQATINTYRTDKVISVIGNTEREGLEPINIGSSIPEKNKEIIMSKPLIEKNNNNIESSLPPLETKSNVEVFNSAVIVKNYNKNIGSVSIPVEPKNNTTQDFDVESSITLNS